MLLHGDDGEKGECLSLVITLHRELIQWVRQHVTGLDQSFGRYYRHYRQELPGDEQLSS
jgi:hypothetical protein